MRHDTALNGLYCIGLGPGDPELITVKALRILKQAAVIHVPQGRIASSLAEDILIRIPEVTGILEKIDFSMAKDVSSRQEHWDRKAAEIRSIIETRGYCVCVTLGDPAIYSTTAYLTEAMRKLDDETPISMVSGISSIQAAASATGQPLVIGEDDMVIVPFPETEDRLRELLDHHGKLICMKIGKKIGNAVAWLSRIEDAYDLRLVKKASLPDQKIYHGIEGLKQADGNLSILMIEKKNRNNA